MRDKFTIGWQWHADIYCYSCGLKLPDVDPESNFKHPIAQWEKDDLGLDSVCAKCHYPTRKWYS